MTIKKLSTLELEYLSLKSKIFQVGEMERFDILLQKLQELEEEIHSPLSKNKRQPKLIW